MWQERVNQAALYELLAHAFLFTTKELAEALSSGEYADALAEIGAANGLDADVLALAADELAPYKDAEMDGLFHEVRTEYTRLFVGAPTPLVSPFAGVWWAHGAGVEPLLFVNKESMAVERFMRSCGIGQPQGTNEPLDHMGSELEFLQYLCLVSVDVLKSSEAVTIPENALEDFYRKHFDAWSKQFAAAIIEHTRLPFYRAVARILAALPAFAETA
jgi:TorA maturation chaperone TorD